MTGIYLIQNIITKESYVGQSVDINRRFTQHKSSSKKGKYPLYRDMRAIGMSNFEFSVLELCEKADLDKREKYWIDHYDSINNGYNTAEPGVVYRDTIRKRFKQRI